MNRGQVVRMDGSATGADLRIWVDDESGHHLTVCEVHLTVRQVAALAVAIEREQERSDQYQLSFDG